MLRGATRVLVRLAEFRAMHLAQLDKRARKLPWSDWLRPEVPFRVEATCRASRIYHHRAAAQRVERAVAETLGAPVSPDAPVVLKVRIEDGHDLGRHVGGLAPQARVEAAGRQGAHARDAGGPVPAGLRL